MSDAFALFAAALPGVGPDAVAALCTFLLTGHSEAAPIAPVSDPVILEATASRSLPPSVDAAFKVTRGLLADKTRAERALLAQLATRLEQTRRDLVATLATALSDFRRRDLTARLADVDRLLADTSRALGTLADRHYRTAANLGQQLAFEPVTATGHLALSAAAGHSGLSARLVSAAMDNTLDLLSVPMQAFKARISRLLRAVALEGESAFSAMAQLSKTLKGEAFDGVAFQAERIIRTEYSRVLNATQHTAVAALGAQLPFVRKGWVATKDARTRLGHQQAGVAYARGSGIPVDQRFRLAVYRESTTAPPHLLGHAEARFPCDPETTPEGRLAARSTILCRCSLITDFDAAQMAAFTPTVTRISLAVPTPLRFPRVPSTTGGHPVAKHAPATTRTPPGGKARLPKGTRHPKTVVRRRV